MINESSPHAVDPKHDETADESYGIDPVVPREGWHVIHLFYQVDRSNWSMYSDEEQLEAKTDLTALIQDIRSADETQLMAFGIVTPKSDIGFLLLTPDLHQANEFEKKLTVSLGPDILSPVYSYLSMTELSEYTTTEAQHAEALLTEEGLTEGSDAFKAKLEEFRRRMKKHHRDRLYPNMPDWQVFCFYPMAMRRAGNDNWYTLDFEERRKLMLEHGRIGRTFEGRVRQLITGSTGLDESEWGVTLFAHNTQDIKEIVYEMRFDEVGARYSEFGDFYIGLQLPLDELFRRVGL